MSIGEELSKTRYKKGIDLKAAEDATKIRAKFLQALENNDFDIVPEPVYVKGFIKAYATFLGLDGYKLSKEYEFIRREQELREKPEPEFSEKNNVEEKERVPELTVKGGYASPSIIQEQSKKRFPWVATILTTIILFIVVMGTFGQITPNSSKPIVIKSDKTGSAKAPVKPKKHPVKPKPENLSVVLVASRQTWVRIKVDGNTAYQGMMDIDESKKYVAKNMVDVLTDHGDRLQVIKNGKDAGPFSSEWGVARKTFTK